MNKNFDYIQDGLTLYCYQGKNQVVELNFETEKEILDFISAIDDYHKNNHTTNQELLDFLKENPEYNSLELKTVFPVLLLASDEKIENKIKRVAQKRGFEKIKSIAEFKDNEKYIGLNIKTKNNKNDFEKNTKFFLDKNIPFLSVDLNQGPYATVGPFCIKKELACPMCNETRIVANDLLYDFHSLVKRQNKEIKEFFEDDFFQDKIIADALNELYFEVAFGRSNLRNFVRNFNYYTGEVFLDGLLPYPSCKLCGN